MLLSAAIDRVQNRVGLAESSTITTTRARDYINMWVTENAALVPWWFLDRTATFSTVSGTAVYSPISGSVTDFYSFVDETNGRLLSLLHRGEFDDLDPELDDSGDPEAVMIDGVSATTGYPQLRLWRIPSSVVVIRVGYHIQVAEWSSTDDATDLAVLGIPPILQNALIYAATALYLEENGDDTGSDREQGNLSRAIRLAQRQNERMLNGDRRFLPIRDEGGALIRVGTSLVTE